MSCYHPMILIKTSDMTDPVQRKIAKKLKLDHEGSGKSVTTFLIPREIAIKEGVKLERNKAVLVPCGHCIGCRLDYSRQWAERCIHEAEEHEHNYFLTLTYDDDHLPIGNKGLATLLNDEISDFMKALRQYWKYHFDFDGIRFFGCSEYGERSLRPHLHILLFNCPIPDLQERHPIKVDGKVKWIKQYDSNDELLMYSPSIGSIWKDRGTAQIGKVTFESAAYVARYIMKKQLGQNAKDYVDAGVIPPYVRMSRRPGIGYNWYNEHFNQIYEFDKVVFKRGDKVIFQNPGKYADNMLKKRDEQRFYDLKEKRHQDFYDSLDCKTFENVDLAINNHRAEDEKIRSAKLLKRNI